MTPFLDNKLPLKAPVLGFIKQTDYKNNNPLDAVLFRCEYHVPLNAFPHYDNEVFLKNDLRIFSQTSVSLNTFCLYKQHRGTIKRGAVSRVGPVGSQYLN